MRANFQPEVRRFKPGSGLQHRIERYRRELFGKSSGDKVAFESGHGADVLDRLKAKKYLLSFTRTVR